MSRKTRCAVCYAALIILTLLLGIAGISNHRMGHPVIPV